MGRIADNNELRLYNDGKGKWQSFEARWMCFSGYGEDAEDAKADLKDNFFKAIMQFGALPWDKPTIVGWDNKVIE